jgi:5-methylcytosine-specific restriction endonuclease McrA
MRAWGGRHATRLLATVVQEYGLSCWLCLELCDPVDPATPRNPRGVSVDHVLPRSRGGSDDLSNLRPAHLRCNAGRGARPPVHRRPVVDASAFFRTGVR